jgi:Leucine-rich repeat (LRR) protein
MNSLEFLDLGYNKVKHLDSGVFSGLVNLKNVSLSGNELQYLHPDSFLELPNIQQLSLSDNMAIQIPTDRNFINSHSLSHLYISRCNISSLSVETFANVSALELLGLEYNRLRTVDINILRALPKLSAIFLNGNPLQCDCQMQEVWRWCEDRNMRSAYGRCDTPSEVKGMWWDVLEKGHCLEGNVEYYEDYNNTYKSFSFIGHKYPYKRDVEFFKQYQLPLYAFPFIFGTISNVILLIIIIYNKDMRTVPNMYILNLAISDIICLTVLFSESCANTLSETWQYGDIMCWFLPFCRRMSVGLSAYSVAVFSFQRYRVTVNPFQVLVSSHATCRSTVAKLCGVWIVAALFAVPSAISNYVCETFMQILSYYQLVVVFELLVSCGLPLCVVVFSYVMTACSLVENSRPISEGTQNPQLETRRNTAKIVVGLAFVFMISFVPYHVFWTYFIHSEYERFDYKLPYFLKRGLHFDTREDALKVKNFNHLLDQFNHKFQYTYLISTFFLLINSCLNPVALFCTSSPFRQHLKRYLTCFCKTNSPSTDLELTRRK